MLTRDIEVNISENDVEVLAEVEYKVTSWGAPESGPSYSSGGEPAEPPEFEIHSVKINNSEINWDDLTEKERDKIDEAIYEELAEGRDDYYDEP